MPKSGNFGTQKRSGARSSRPQDIFTQWCTEVCQNANGASIVTGMGLLGPVASFSDLLLNSDANPQKILAAEQLVHLVEGWRYAAAATNSALSHATDQALHLAYYAELRAAMSLFAWSGIRVKQHGYYYLNSNGNKITIKNQRTHAAVWGLWKEWVKRIDAKSLFNDNIRLHPLVTLSHVTESLRYVNTTATLTNWGLDLWNATLDHNARNKSSYEAGLASTCLSRMEETDVALILDLWRLFLSDGSSLVFDAALINYMVADAVPKLVQQSQSDHKPSNQDQLSDIALSIATSTGIDAKVIANRLNHSAYPTTPFAMAADSATKVNNVLCRGYFLLRMAMLATKKSIGTNSSNPIEKWMENWFLHAGIWDPADGIALPDIEEDYKTSVNDLNVSLPLPSSLWKPQNIALSAKLTRPDACMAWGLFA